MPLKAETKHSERLWLPAHFCNATSVSSSLSFRITIAVLMFFSTAVVNGKSLNNNPPVNTIKAISSVTLGTVPVTPLWGGAALSINQISPQIKTIALHHFDLPCATCHEPGYNANMTDHELNQTNTKPGPLTSDINRTCTTTCHDYEQALNHPVGITYTKTVSPDMPLDRNSRITCLTCHSQPTGSTTSQNNNIQQEPFLHTPKDTQLCASCHGEMRGNMKQRSHWQFSSRAHLADINPASTDTKEENFSINHGDIDRESNTCLGCHQDKTVTIIPSHETIAQKKARWREMKDHPIGMEYQQVATQKKTKYPFQYPIANTKIRLFDGRVGCGSCHSLYSKNENNIVQNNGYNALCRDCHNK